MSESSRQKGRRTPVGRALHPFQEFAKKEASSGILLLVAAVTALVCANSPLGATYASLWQSELTIRLGNFSITKDLILWINDGLMAIFFLVVSLEIKREVLVGKLSSVRRAALPIVAALGGAVVPAGIYLALNAGTEGSEGWGIPMATDIAFALGVLALLGDRVPLALKAFLLALAIVDDIVAVMVIALFYTEKISWSALAIGAGFVIALVVINLGRVRQPLTYALLGVGLWLALLQSGIHATIAGVLLATTIPTQARINTDEFLNQSRKILDHFDRAGERGESVLANEERQSSLQALEAATERVETPLQRIERSLHPWVIFAIMPLFALANAGVPLGEGLSKTLIHPVSLGIIAGLVVGKQVGVVLFAWLAVKSGLAEMPAEVSWSQIYGVSWLAGIGFTLSLFIADLAFPGDPLLDVAKVGILAASLTAGITGFLILRVVSSSRLSE